MNKLQFIKLYEFSITDGFNLPKSKIIEQVKIEMSQQAIEENWAPGYTYKESQKQEILPTGEKRYHFTVYGKLK